MFPYQISVWYVSQQVRFRFLMSAVLCVFKAAAVQMVYIQSASTVLISAWMPTPVRKSAVTFNAVFTKNTPFQALSENKENDEYFPKARAIRGKNTQESFRIPSGFNEEAIHICRNSQNFWLFRYALIQQLILYSDRRWCPQSATLKAYYFAFKAKEKRNLVIPNCAKMQNNRISLRWHYPNQVMGQSVTAYSQPAPAGSPVVYKNTDFIQYFLFFL